LRIIELKKGVDKNKEFTNKELKIKKILYTNIVKKIQETKEKINDEENNLVTDEEVSTINKILDEAEKHFGSKLTSHA